MTECEREAQGLNAKHRTQHAHAMSARCLFIICSFEQIFAMRLSLIVVLKDLFPSLLRRAHCCEASTVLNVDTVEGRSNNVFAVAAPA